VPDSERSDGVDRGVLDSAVSDIGGARVQGLFGQRALFEECARTQERRIRLPVDPVSALGRVAAGQLPATRGDLRPTNPVAAPDAIRFRHASAFASWIGLCPEKRVSGGKVLSCKTRKVKHRAATALRMGANSLCRAKGYFGEFFRRMRAKLGTAQAITATAHKIARILYHVLSTKELYAETVFHRYDEQARQRAEMRLRKQAARLGFQLLAIPATGE
jgi:hypothetical protein